MVLAADGTKGSSFSCELSISCRFGFWCVRTFGDEDETRWYCFFLGLGFGEDAGEDLDTSPTEGAGCATRGS